VGATLPSPPARQPLPAVANHWPARWLTAAAAAAHTLLGPVQRQQLKSYCDVLLDEHDEGMTKELQRPTKLDEPVNQWLCRRVTSECRLADSNKRKAQKGHATSSYDGPTIGDLRKVPVHPDFRNL
jgi:hypothetical protein